MARQADAERDAWTLLHNDYRHLHTSHYLTAGVSAAKRRPGIALLLWAIHALVALVVALPVAGVFAELEARGFGTAMARSVDITIMADLTPEVRSALRRLALNLAWAIPLLALVRAVTSAGVINATRDGGLRTFWSGVGRYGPKSIAVGIPYLALGIALQAALIAIVVSVASMFGEQGAVLTFLVVLPVGMAIIGATTDCMLDYSRMALIIRDEPMLRSIGTGMGWPFRHPRAIPIYAFWMVVGAVLVLLPLFLDNAVTGGTVATVLVLTIAQQALLIVRSGVTVAWYGSEVAFFEEVADAEAPLIAGAEELMSDDS